MKFNFTEVHLQKVWKNLIKRIKMEYHKLFQKI
jgi:hypothetical protein